jgi:putative acetyltransferase
MSSAPAISIAVETPLSDEMRVMVGELNDLLLSLTSEDACHHLTVEQMADARTTVFVARVDGKLAACGSLYRHKGSVAEVKRMYTRPAYQSLGLGRKLLDRILALAIEEGFSEAALETGVNYARPSTFTRPAASKCAARSWTIPNILNPFSIPGA